MARDKGRYLSQGQLFVILKNVTKGNTHASHNLLRPLTLQVNPTINNRYKHMIEKE